MMMPLRSLPNDRAAAGQERHGTLTCLALLIAGQGTPQSVMFHRVTPHVFRQTLGRARLACEQRANQLRVRQCPTTVNACGMHRGGIPAGPPAPKREAQSASICCCIEHSRQEGESRRRRHFHCAGQFEGDFIPISMVLLY